MQKPRTVETPEHRGERRSREARMKSDDAAAEEIAIDRMIRRNIEQHGP
jgi:hypothetical protein